MFYAYKLFKIRKSYVIILSEINVIYCHHIAEESVKNVDGQKLAALVDLDAGKLFCSSKGSMLTEPETEYVVRCIKHIFNQHLILQVCRLRVSYYKIVILFKTIIFFIF